MAYSYKEVVKILKENGWQLKRTSGSHEIYVSTEGKTCPIKCTKRYTFGYIKEHREDHRD